jgi:chaperonin cofactor prefoldin
LQSGYDALGGEKPFLTSDKEVLKKYFFKGTIFVKNEKEDIKKGIREIFKKYEILKKEISELKLTKLKKWEDNIKALKAIIEDD